MAEQKPNVVHMMQQQYLAS